MHEEVLPGSSRDLLAVLERLESRHLRGWTLAGGTGLALRLGHRVSEDFDFFRLDALDGDGLHQTLRRVGEVETLQEAEHTLTVVACQTKLSFFRVLDPFVFPGSRYRFFEVADVRDIALMKLVAISGRGSRKDFVDLYSILRGGLTLRQCFEWLPRKYGRGRANSYHILKSLAYFEDAEREPLPSMLVPVDWAECKAFFVREALAIVLP